MKILNEAAPVSLSSISISEHTRSCDPGTLASWEFWLCEELKFLSDVLKAFDVFIAFIGQLQR